MKYIKLFNESSIEEYYDRIDQDEFMRLFHNKVIDISKNNVTKLSKHFNKWAGMIIHPATEEPKLLEDEKNLLKSGMGTSRTIRTWDLKLKYLGKEKGSIEMINIMFSDMSVIGRNGVKMSSKAQVQIWETEDEWFIVDITIFNRIHDQHYFKCDQTEGVWELLKDLIKDEKDNYHWFL